MIVLVTQGDAQIFTNSVPVVEWWI